MFDNWEQWKPRKRELSVELLVFIVIPAYNIWQAISEDRSTWVLITSTLGTMVLLLALFAFYTFLRGPRRYHNLSDEALVHDVIDGWIKTQRWGRQAVDRDGYAEALQIQINGVYFIIGKLSKKSAVHVWCWISLDATQAPTMGVVEMSDFKHEISLEMARFGLFSQYGDSLNFAATYWTEIATNELTAKDFLKSVDLVRRADAFIRILWSKNVSAASLKQVPPQSAPDPQPPTNS